MSIRASNKRWIAALSAALMVCVCASACAQDYSLGDEADEIATIQTALKQLKLYSAGITGHYGEKKPRSRNSRRNTRLRTTAL